MCSTETLNQQRDASITQHYISSLILKNKYYLYFFNFVCNNAIRKRDFFGHFTLVSDKIFMSHTEKVTAGFTLEEIKRFAIVTFKTFHLLVL